ncbi:hypothetical protein COCC4DRAFT_31645, partial [Bipolaris maydis ATCC 48331]
MLHMTNPSQVDSHMSLASKVPSYSSSNVAFMPWPLVPPDAHLRGPRNILALY